MNLKCLGLLLLLPVSAMRADEPTAIDLFAGWSVYPFGTGYPYPYHHPGYDGWLGGGPFVGLSRTWPYAEDPWPYRYGVGAYPYDWGFGYGVRMRIYPGSPLRLSTPTNSWLAPFPGSAPTTLKDARQEQAWDEDILSFLSTLPTAAERLAATNSTPASR